MIRCFKPTKNKPKRIWMRTPDFLKIKQNWIDKKGKLVSPLWEAGVAVKPMKDVKM